MFKLNKWINTRTYNLHSGISISFIEDDKSGIVYLLKKEMSEIWNIIVSCDNSKDLSLMPESENFVKELKSKNILKSDNTKIDIKNKYLTEFISKKDKNYEIFENIKTRMLIENNFLEILYLDLTYKCNLNCKHCCNPKDKNQFEINFKNAKKIIDEAYELGVFSVLITGGECTLNKDFLKIAKYVKQKHLELHIKTNGQTLFDDENLFKKIVNLYPAYIDISIYSLNPQIHDYITGVNGSLRKSLQVVEKLKMYKMNVSIASIMLSYNKNETDLIEQYAKKLGIGFLCDHKFIYNNKNKNLNARIDDKNAEKVYIGKLNNEKPRKKFIKNDRLICNAGIDRLSVDPNLDILPCLYFYYKLGNFKKNSLKEIKEKIIPEFQKKFVRSNLKECFKHDYCEYCMYCPSYTISDRGFLKKSHTLCEDAKAYKKALYAKK